MAQLFFKYGAMNAGKSLSLLTTAHNYQEQNKDVLIMTSAIDDRYGVGKVSSRVGLSCEAQPIKPEDNVIELITKSLKLDTEGRTVWPHCILIDEAEFLTAQQVVDLANIVDTYNIPIICYGLRTDFQCNLFEGSKTLFEVADKLEEIKTVCQWCDHKATMNLRMVDGSPVYDGNQIQIGDQEYISVCRYHYTNPVIKVTKNKKEKEE